MAELKTIKVNEEDFDRVIKAREELINKGVNSLPEGYRELVREEIKGEMKLTNGLIVALGAILLIKLLSEITS